MYRMECEWSPEGPGAGLQDRRTLVLRARPRYAEWPDGDSYRSQTYRRSARARPLRAHRCYFLLLWTTNTYTAIEPSGPSGITRRRSTDTSFAEQGVLTRRRS